MDLFNIVAGAISILAAAFAVYTFAESRKKEAVETQKAAEYKQRIADLISMTNAVAQQGNLIAALADRDDVTKKELKHLIISQLATVASVQASLQRTRSIERRWRFGTPAAYLRIEAEKDDRPDEEEVRQ